MEIIEITADRRHDPLVSQTFDLVLSKAFSSDELPSFETIATGWESSRSQLMLVGLDSSRPIAAAVCSQGAPGISTLDYLAVHPDFQNHGIGRRLLDRLRSLWSTRPTTGFLAEVHDSRFYPTSLNDRPVDRLRFYERAGACLLDVPWVQPRLSPATQRVSNMLLLNLLPQPSQSLSSAMLVAWMENYFLSEEGVVPTDTVVTALRQRLVESDLVKMVPIEGFDVTPLQL